MTFTLFFTTDDPAEANAEDAVLALTLEQTDSWFAQGANDPVTSDQIVAAGGEQLVTVADSLQLTPQQLGAQLAETLPVIIDRLTPDGSDGQVGEPVPGTYQPGSGQADTRQLMRFHSPDSMSPFGDGGINPYAYSLGDPSNMTDPSGQ